MRLLSIELNDFQAHKKVLVELSPTITTIRGPTDTGKSAILRALRWACLNDIAGEEFIREGQKQTTVIVRVQAGDVERVIRRIRSTGGVVNTYELGGEEYK